MIKKEVDSLTEGRGIFKGLFHGHWMFFPYPHRKKLDEAVQCFMKGKNLDILDMVAKNLNFLEGILFRPNVEKICYPTTVPFLALHKLKT